MLKNKTVMFRMCNSLRFISIFQTWIDLIMAHSADFVYKFLLQLKWLERKDLIRQEFTSLHETITARQQQLLADMEEV